MNSIRISLLFVIFSFAPCFVIAQEGWQLNGSITAMTGSYTDSLTMNHQHGLGMRMSGEKNQQWGLTTGLQSTRIAMAPITQVSTQNQDNWLLSGFVHSPSSTLLGRWTFQIDTHQIHNDASSSPSSDVRAIAPQITWLSYGAPVKADFSLARSKYKDKATVHQVSLAIAYGFNNATDWLQIRGYAISNLDIAMSPEQTRTHATDIKLTHLFNRPARWTPTSVTIGLERGQRIYVVDMTSQTVINLPMRNKGGENITAQWKLNPASTLSLQYSKTRYYSEAQGPLVAHHLTLQTLSAQLATAW